MKKFYIVQAFLSILVLIVNIILYPYLPDFLPIHWSSNGLVNGEIPKYGIFIFPIALMIMAVLFILLERSNKKVGKTIKKTEAMILVFVVAIFFAICVGLSVYYIRIFL